MEAPSKTRVSGLLSAPSSSSPSCRLPSPPRPTSTSSPHPKPRRLCVGLGSSASTFPTSPLSASLCSASTRAGLLLVPAPANRGSLPPCLICADHGHKEIILAARGLNLIHESDCKVLLGTSPSLRPGFQLVPIFPGRLGPSQRFPVSPAPPTVDPTTDFHSNSILWNPSQVIFLAGPGPSSSSPASPLAGPSLPLSLSPDLTLEPGRKGVDESAMQPKGRGVICMEVGTTSFLLHAAIQGGRVMRPVILHSQEALNKG